MAQSEKERLKALRSTGALDHPSNARLDHLTAKVAELLETPIALISLVDDERLQFLSRVGLNDAKTPREGSFCTLAIEQAPQSVFVVTDATADSRFSASPLVAGEPHIRFYAGAVLTDHAGFNLGSLCAIDTKPRDCPTPEALEKLQLLAQLVVAEIEILKRDQLLEEGQAFFDMNEDISGLASWKYDVASQTFTGSPLAYRIHGIDEAYPSDIPSILGLYAAEDREKIVDRLEAALTSAADYSLQCRIVRPDGAQREVLIKAKCRTNALGEVTAIVGVFQDITEQVAASKEVAEVRRQTERLNWALEAFAKSAAELNRFEDPVSLFERICESIVEGDRYPLAAVCLANDDQEMSISVISSKGPAKDYLIGKKFSWSAQALSGQGPAGRSVRSKDLIVVRDVRSEPGLDLWRQGALDAGLLGIALIPFDAPDYKAGLLAVYADVADGFSAAELEIFSKLAAELSYALKLEKSRRSLIESDRGRTQLIEELQQSRAAIFEALERANAANLAKSTFLANMSHELRTPLNGILGVAGALRMAMNDPRKREMVSLIEESATTLNLILSDILDWSKVEAGKLSLSIGPFSPIATLKPTIDLMAVRAEEKGLTFVLDRIGDVELRLEGDALRINQILGNLISNAIKFTDRGQITCRLEVKADSEGAAALVLSVKDTGSGFDEAQKTRLFDRFEQLDAGITKRHGGTGLGLPIVAALVDLMGGVLSVSSRPGEGSEFTIRLPLKAAAKELAQISATHDIELQPGLRVLLAEDHATNQKVVSMILEAYGAELTITANGEEAVAAWSAGEYDLILMDMQMPKMGGLEAIKIIRERELDRGRPYTPIAVLTANVGKEHLEASLGAGADGYIAKPIGPQALLTGIQRTFEHTAAKFGPV